MFQSNILKAGFVAAVLAVGSLVPSHAFRANTSRSVALTFNRPFALPGIALGSGTYIFELASPERDLTIVRVSSQDRSKVYYTGYTYLVPAIERPKRAGHIVFGESAVDAPPPVRIWYPPDDSTGRRFIYPHDSPQLSTRSN